MFDASLHVGLAQTGKSVPVHVRDDGDGESGVLYDLHLYKASSYFVMQLT